MDVYTQIHNHTKETGGLLRLRRILLDEKLHRSLAQLQEGDSGEITDVKDDKLKLNQVSSKDTTGSHLKHAGQKPCKTILKAYENMMIDLLECFTTIVGIEPRIKTENFAFNMIFDFDSVFNVLADSLLKTVLKSDPKNYRKYDADLLLELYEAGSQDFSDSF